MTEYDAHAEAYARHRREEPAVLDALARRAPGRVLEVGCGTGNYAIALHERTGASCSGVDPSEEMVAVARRRAPALDFRVGRAEELPWADGEFELVFAVDVVHHLEEPAAAIAEAARVLRPGGRLCLATDDEETIRSRVHSRYFPESVAVELARYPSLDALREAMRAAGLLVAEEERVTSPTVITDAGPYRDKAHSSLWPIPEQAFERGLERLERDLRRGPVEAARSMVLLWAVLDASARAE